MPVDVIIYGAIALALVFALRSVLGMRHGDERSRPNPFAGPAADGAAQPAPSVVGAAAAPRALPGTASIAVAAQNGLAAIAKADNSFDPARFIHGAQDAFVLIVEAFAKGDRTALRDLLSDAVLQAFTTVIDRRENAGEQASVEILAVRRLEILAATLEARVASITVRFVADETLFVRDRDDKVIEGNPDRVSEVIDIWTFTRDLSAKNAAKNENWRVAETRQEEGVVAIDATPPVAH